MDLNELLRDTGMRLIRYGATTAHPYGSHKGFHLLTEDDVSVAQSENIEDVIAFLEGIHFAIHKRVAVVRVKDDLITTYNDCFQIPPDECRQKWRNIHIDRELHAQQELKTKEEPCSATTKNT